MKTIPALLAVLAFTSVCCAQVLFEDDFSRGKSSRWRQKNDGSSAAEFRVQGGFYVLTSRDPLMSLPRSIVHSLAQTNTWISGEVEITPRNRAFASASLISYYSDGGHFYELSLDALSNYWSLQKIDKTGSSLLAQGPVPQSRQRHRLGLYVHGSEIRAFIDGLQVAKRNVSAPLASGGFGISARGAEARWDSIRVVASDPNDFVNRFRSSSTAATGIARFANLQITVTDPTGRPLPGITVYRIQRDAVSYYVFHDPRGRFPPRSGFAEEFLKQSETRFVVMLGGPPERSRSYRPHQLQWLLDFLESDARDSANAETQIQRIRYSPIFYESSFLRSNGSPVSDGMIGTSGAGAESNAVLFGKWEETGNYRMFPSLSGKLSNGNELISRFTSLLHFPQRSKCTLYVLQLSTSESSPVFISWLVQEDSRSFVFAENAQFPSSLQRGESYRIPFVLRNDGEAAGPIQASILVSTNSSLGRNDARLGEIRIAGMAAHSSLPVEIPIIIPSDLTDGRYFIGTFLESEASGNRVFNFTSTVRAVTLGDFPGSGNLQISLEWNGTADLDLHVTDPFGENIYYFQPASITGGRLLADNECSLPREEISYASGAAPSGTYIVSIHFIRPCDESRDATWKLRVDADGRTQEFSGAIRPGQFLRIAEITR